MSTFMIEPGTRLAGRYRLEDRVREAGGCTLWKATDETLARPVAVRTFDEGFPRIHQVVTAARAASRLTDSRISQVFDADDTAGQAYVVEEWVVGESLTDLLAHGPLEPERAAGLISEVAESLTVAHAAGLAHLCLSPNDLRWTSGGAVKLTGLGVDAALHGVTVENPAASDAQGIAALLYAALTGHWPGERETPLPPAPLFEGRPCAPRQVRAGVPTTLDTLICRALFQEERRGQPPLSSPAAIAEALTEVPRSIPLPIAPAAAPSVRRRTSTAPQHMAPPPAQQPYQEPPRRSRPLLGRALIALVVVLVMAAIGLGGWAIGRAVGPTMGGSPSASASPTAGSGLAALTPVGAPEAHDPPPGDGAENNEDGGLAVDDSRTTAWRTQSYRGDPRFGNLKDGVGLIFDMGKPVTVREADLLLGSQPGTSLQVMVGDSPEADAMQPVAKRSGVAQPQVKLPIDNPQEGRYVLVWFTELPPKAGGGEYQAELFDAKFRGSS
ncbi:MAG: serine/threonine protein kinase [Streptosporangiales bacterium]|nr:serine/threonine protein kinase [Streptosporangiales bacterium]